MKQSDHRELGKLLKKAQSGDLKAFEEIYRRTSPIQFSQIRTLLKGIGMEEDALQETYLLLYKNLTDIYRPTALVAYLNRVSFFVCQNIRKHYGRTNVYRIPFTDVTDTTLPRTEEPLSVLLKKEYTLLLQNAYESLEPEEQIVLSMHHLQAMTLKETAYAMDTSVSRVKRLQLSARCKLKKELTVNGYPPVLLLFPHVLFLKFISLPTAPPFSKDILKETVAAGPRLPGKQRNSHAIPAAILGWSLITAVLLSIVAPAPSITSVKLHNIKTSDGVITFQVKSILPLRKVILKSNEVTVPIVYDKEYFSAKITSEGNYTLTVINTAGKKTDRTIHITNINP